MNTYLFNEIYANVNIDTDSTTTKEVIPIVNAQRMFAASCENCRSISRSMNMVRYAKISAIRSAAERLSNSKLNEVNLTFFVAKKKQINPLPVIPSNVINTMRILKNQ